MPRKAKPLSALEVGRLKTPGLHFVGTVDGLALQVSDSGARSWLLRAKVGNRRREIGLGGYPAVPLAEAHAAARAKRALIKSGIDPVLERVESRSRLIAEQAGALTFRRVADDYIKAHESEWRNLKHAQQWRRTLETYAYPVFGDMLVRDIGTSHLMAVLSPIWGSKTETASRVRGRIESILGAAIALKLRPEPNPARWKANLEPLLANPGKLKKKTREHHRAVPVAEVGAFVEQLRKEQGTAARALEFAILTAARGGEVRGATWDEIDFEAKLWTVPAERIKAGKLHRVPLSPAAIKLLKALPRFVGETLIFPSTRAGTKLSDMALLSVMRRMQAGAVPHGFRSTFRDWCAEHTNYPREVAEVALAHSNKDETEAAYLRSDLFVKRRRLMEEWAAWCGSPTKKGAVIALKGRRT
jgi:integrase